MVGAEMKRRRLSHKAIGGVIAALVAGGAFGASSAAAAEIVVDESPAGASAPPTQVAVVASDVSGAGAPKFTESPKPRVMAVAKRPAPAKQAPSASAIRTVPAVQTTATRPKLRTVAARSAQPQLPNTGFPAGVVAAAGLVLVLLGLRLRTRAARLTPAAQLSSA